MLQTSFSSDCKATARKLNSHPDYNEATIDCIEDFCSYSHSCTRICVDCYVFDDDGEAAESEEEEEEEKEEDSAILEEEEEEDSAFWACRRV